MTSSMKTDHPKKIFISRELEADSSFHKLSQQGHTIIAQSLIDFEFLEFSVAEKFDAVFFYSQKSIAHFFSKFPYDSKSTYGVMGSGSQATFVRLTGQDPDIIGADSNTALASTINKKWAGKNVFFPIASQSLQSLDQLLTVDHFSVIVYNNQPKENIKLPICDLYLLTSPMNARSFLSKNNFGNATVYAIGATTASEIKRITGQTVLYCKQPSIENLYQLTLTKL